MFKIGEFSRLTQVSIRMLRYYDEAGLLKPAEVDKWTAHRMYAIEQIPRLNKIVYLRDSGFHVSEIALALEMDDNALLACLEKKRLEVEQTIQGEQEKLRRLALAKDEIQGGKSELHYHISLKSIPAYQVLSLRRTIPSYDSEGELWAELAAFSQRHKVEASDMAFTLYHDAEYKGQDVDVELCVPVNKSHENGDLQPFTLRVTEPVPTMACTMIYGDFSHIKGAYAAFAQWLQKNSEYQISNPTRQIVHRGPWNESDPQKYLIEIQIPLERC